MNIDKQHSKLLKIMAEADQCVDRKTSRKLIKKATKIYNKLNK